MTKLSGKLFVVLLCVLMVVGGLDIGALAGPMADHGGLRTTMGAIASRADSRATKTVTTTTFADWQSGGINNLTVFNESGGELKIKGFQSFTVPAFITGISDLEVDARGDLLISVPKGAIAKVDAVTGAITDQGNHVPDENHMMSLRVDTNDTLWCGGTSDDVAGGAHPNRGGIVARMNTTSMKFDADWRVTLPWQSNTAQVRGLTADKNGTIWSGTMNNGDVATRGIVVRIDPTTGAMTRTINGNNPIINGYGIWMMTAGNNGFIYGGTTMNGGGNGGRVFKVDPTTNTPTVLNGGNALVNTDMIMSMTTANNGTIYIGTAMTAGDLFMLDPDTDTFTNLGKPIAGDNSISDLWPAPDGSVWGFAGSNAMEPHLFMVQNGTGKIIDMGVPISGNAFPGFLAIAHDGTVWGAIAGLKIFKFKPVYEKIPAVRLDRTQTGRIFNDDWALSATDWNPTSGVWRRDMDNTSPSGDPIVYQQTDTTNVFAFSRAGAFGNLAADPLTFSLSPVGVLELQFKFNTPDAGNGPRAIRLYMGDNGAGGAYGLFITEDTNQIELERDWAWWGNNYNTPLDPGYWYTIKWKVVQPGAGGSSTVATVWLNGTKIFDAVNIPLPNRDGGAIQLETRHYNASFDNIRLYRDTNINVNGLSAGQNVSLYAWNGTLLSSAVAVGAAVSLPVDGVSFPLVGHINVTGTDGTTVVLSNAYYDIYGGDVYTFVQPASAWKYLSNGTYLSQPFDAQYTVAWGNISWGGKKPANTNISLRTRSAGTLGGLAAAPWSAPYWAVSDTAITSPANRFIQFEAFLSSTDPLVTPELDWVNMTYKVFPGFEIDLAQSSATVYPMDIISYNISYNQTGNGLARDVWITDKLPAVLTFVDSSNEAARLGSVWHLKDIAPGADGTLTINARVSKDAADGLVIKNNASLKFTDEANAAIGNITSNDAVATVVRPALGFSLAGPTGAGPGEPFNYTMAFNNTGTGHAKELWLNLTLDANLTITNSSAEGWRTGASWDITGTHDAESIDITVLVNASVPDGAKLKASAVLNYTYPNDYMPAGLKAGPLETTVSRPMATAHKSVDLANALPGDKLVYTVQFNNTGSAAGKMVIKDTLAPELELVTSSAEANRTGGTWSFASVPAGSHNELRITAWIKNDTLENISITNNATIGLATLTGLDLGQLTTNTVSTHVGILPKPKITIAMVADRTWALWNETVNFTVYYNNTGNENASLVSIKVLLPLGLTFTTSTAEANRAGVYWNFTNLPTGSHSFKFTAKVDPGTANNTALTTTATLSYADMRHNSRPGSQASAAISVKVPVKPPIVDTTKPSVTGKFPAPDAKDVPAGTTIEITFSEAMNRTSAEAAFSISPGVTGKISWVGNKLVFTPDQNLTAGKKYTVSVGTTAKDLAGNPLDKASSWSFTVKGKTVVKPGGGLNLLCIGGIIAAIVALLVGVGYLLSRRKGDKEPSAPQTRARPTKEETEEEAVAATTVPPKTKAQPKEEEEPELAETRERAIPEEEPSKDVTEPEKAPAKDEAPTKPEEKPVEPVKEGPKPEKKAPEPVKEEKTEPGPPKSEPEAKKEEKKNSDIDDILSKLKG